MEQEMTFYYKLLQRNRLWIPTKKMRERGRQRKCKGDKESVRERDLARVFSFSCVCNKDKLSDFNGVLSVLRRSWKLPYVKKNGIIRTEAQNAFIPFWMDSFSVYEKSPLITSVQIVKEKIFLSALQHLFLLFCLFSKCLPKRT